MQITVTDKVGNKFQFDEPPLTSWSYSRLEVFERCRYRAYLKWGEKRPEANDPKREEALNRGQKTHDDAEGYVKGRIDTIPKGLAKFAENFNRVRELYESDPSMFVIEEDWAFTKEWTPTGWFDDDAWLRLKLDRLEWKDTEHTVARMVDYKTGKKEGNEVKHGQQGQLYMVACFMMFPDLEVLEVEFEYLDHGKKSLRKTYTRDQMGPFLESFTKRGLAMTEATEFRPKPNRINCAWCPYGPNKGDGSCEYGVEV